jgi:uncharacterized protein (DUF2062 family)
VWITNPATIPFVFAFTYWVGRFFWSGPPVSEVTRVLYRTVRKLGTLDFWEIYDQFMVFAAFSRNIFIPLIIGGALVGATAGILAYFFSVQSSGVIAAGDWRERHRFAGYLAFVRRGVGDLLPRGHRSQRTCL